MQGNDGAANLETLRAVFADQHLKFRHFEDCAVPFMSWQCGRNVLEEVEGERGYWMFVEKFRLIAYASTANGLVDKLALLNGASEG